MPRQENNPRWPSSRRVPNIRPVHAIEGHAVEGHHMKPHHHRNRSPFGDYPSYSNQRRNFWYPGHVLPQYFPMSYVHPQGYPEFFGNQEFFQYSQFSPFLHMPRSPLIYEFPLMPQQIDIGYIGDPLDGLEPI